MKFQFRELEQVNDISEFETCLIQNLAPNSYDEAITLIPSLKERPIDAVTRAITIVSKYKH